VPSSILTLDDVNDVDEQTESELIIIFFKCKYL
jgi:hypothetical protein